jgi:hypothetical protein
MGELRTSAMVTAAQALACTCLSTPAFDAVAAYASQQVVQLCACSYTIPVLVLLDGLRTSQGRMLCHSSSQKPPCSVAGPAHVLCSAARRCCAAASAACSALRCRWAARAAGPPDEGVRRLWELHRADVAGALLALVYVVPRCEQFATVGWQCVAHPEVHMGFLCSNMGAVHLMR